MSRCAGVQKVSRPMDMCHEMSQYTPTITHSAAKTTVGAYAEAASAALYRRITPAGTSYDGGIVFALCQHGEWTTELDVAAVTSSWAEDFALAGARGGAMNGAGAPGAS